MRKLLQKSAELFNDGKYEAMYALYSEESQEDCSLGDFLDVLEAAKLFIGGADIEIRNIEVTVEGDIAYASYTTYAGGERINTESGDTFVKIDGRWYDDNPCA